MGTFGRTKILALTIIAGVLILGLYAFWAALPVDSRTCEDGDNVCLYHTMLDVSNASLEKSGTHWDAAVQEMLDLCSRMGDSHKKDECLIVVVSSTDGEAALKACSQFFDIHYKSDYSSHCELREIQSTLRSSSGHDLDEELFEQTFRRCGQLTDQHAIRYICFLELAQSFFGELAITACKQLPSISDMGTTYPFTSESCLREIDTIQG